MKLLQLRFEIPIVTTWKGNTRMIYSCLIKPTRFAEFVQAGNNRLRLQPKERLGQAFFNALYLHNMGVAEQIRASEYDPFYNDATLPAFFDRVWELI